ncbi:UNVERIFIED_CONTAM: hypothetical protein FKN15_026225 [Acipenser sinensis]
MIAESREQMTRKWTGPMETQKHGTPLSKKTHDGTKTTKIKTEQLLRVDDFDFSMRPAFAEAASSLTSALEFLGVEEEAGLVV